MAGRRRVSPAFCLSNSLSTHDCSRRGFSLIELLVAMACMAVLASLLVPALQSAQARGRRIRCVSNLHQVGVSLCIYVSETGFYPLALDSRGLGNWQRALWPSSTDPVLYCPQQMRAGPEFLEYFPADQFVFPHYGYNSSGAVRVNPPPKNPGLGGTYVWNKNRTGGYFAQAAENWVQAPSQMIAIGDSMTFVMPPLNTPNLTPADPMYQIFPFILEPQNYPGVSPSHTEGANMFFCDAHVEFAKQTNWLSPSDAVKCLWNADHLSHTNFQ